MSRACLICGASLERRRPDARTCSDDCRADADRLRRTLDGRAAGFDSVADYLQRRDASAAAENSTPQQLLIVTADGHGKRLPLEDVLPRRRGRKGVRVSSEPIAAAVIVQPHEEIIVITRGGKVERIAAAGVRILRRRVLKAGTLSKGVPIIRLAPGDQVAAVAVARTVDDHDAPTATMPGAAAVALRHGERFGPALAGPPLRPLAEVRNGGRLAVDRDEWTVSSVHQASRYWCGHCSREHPDPHAVYACMDSHADSGRWTR